MAKLPTYEEMGKKIAEEALDRYIYKGKTLREWVDILAQTKSEYEHDHDVVKAYNDGQAFILDKIKAEIEEMKLDVDLDIGNEMIYNNAIKDVLEIIDKYRGERMTTADLLKRMHDYDIAKHPYALYCNPEDAKELKEHLPETVKLVPLSTVDKGISYLVDRAKCENLYIPCFDILGGDTDG